MAKWKRIAVEPPEEGEWVLLRSPGMEGPAVVGFLSEDGKFYAGEAHSHSLADTHGEPQEWRPIDG